MKLFDIWEKAIPLSRAFIRFGNREAAAEYTKLRETTSAVAMLGAITERAEQGDGFLEAFQNATKPTAPARKRASHLAQALKEETLHHVSKGVLVAYGYSQPRHASDKPQRVPRDLWSGTVNWEADKITGNGLKMEAVRLVPAQWLTSQSLPAPVGRPGRQQQTTEAFHALHKEGRIDFIKPMKANYPAIRNWVKAHYPDENHPDHGLSDKTLARDINPLILKHKKTAET